MAAPKRNKALSPAGGEAVQRLLPAPGEAVVRMYRIGHGDCFLLAFEGDAPDRPIYVLIDCGYKPGSSKLVHKKQEDASGTQIGPNRIKDIARHIHGAT